MTNDHKGRNYFAHGGSELVLGGKLTFLPGATVEGADGLFDLPAAIGMAATIPPFPDSAATTVTALREDFNHLLTVLRAAGIMATAEETAEDGDG